MYGVGAPTAEEYNAAADAGIGTFICMHATPEVIEGVQKHGKANLIIAGHMASDSLGFNQILDAWEKALQWSGRSEGMYQYCGFLTISHLTRRGIAPSRAQEASFFESVSSLLRQEKQGIALLVLLCKSSEKHLPRPHRNGIFGRLSVVSPAARRFVM